MELKEKRTKQKLTQKQVAQYLRITTQAYANYEQGLREPNIETLTKLAKLFKCSIDELIGLEKKEPEKIEFKTESFTEKQKEILQYVKKLDDQQCKLALLYFKTLLDDFVEVEQIEEEKKKENN